MINRTILVGRLTRDPELRNTGNGVNVTNFTIAVNRSFKNASGEYEADFIQIVAWRGLAETICNNIKKGSLVGVDGRIQTRNYEAEDGRTVYITEIVADRVQFLEPKGAREGAQNTSYQNTTSTNAGNNRSQTPPPEETIGDDVFEDFPF